MKHLDETIGEYTIILGVGKDFLNRTQKHES